jgi:hypothetical protein
MAKMVDRLRVLLDRPLDPRAGRGIVVLATAISFGFSALVVLAGTAEQGSRSVSAFDRGTAPVHPASDSLPAEAPPFPPQETHHRQDPQDDWGSAAGRRAENALRSHRALQHVPFHGVGIAVALAGARHGRAVLVVSAPTVASARRGWRKFLRRFGDGGDAYVPVFKVDQQATPWADQQATHRATRQAGSSSRQKPAIAHRRRDCADTVSQRSPLHIEVCS